MPLQKRCWAVETAPGRQKHARRRRHGTGTGGCKTKTRRCRFLPSAACLPGAAVPTAHPQQTRGHRVVLVRVCSALCWASRCLLPNLFIYLNDLFFFYFFFLSSILAQYCIPLEASRLNKSVSNTRYIIVVCLNADEPVCGCSSLLCLLLS